MPIIVKMDEQNRITLPDEVMDALLLESGDKVEIRVNRRTVSLLSTKPYCYFCGDPKSEVLENGFHLCKRCLSQLFNKAFTEEEVKRYLVKK